MTARLHLAVFYTGVGPQFLWDDPSNADHTKIETYVSVARTLERGLFDAFFLGEGLRVRENRGRVHALDVAGRPDAITQLSALAAATTRIGLVATQNTTYNFPADLAHRLSSLDFLSGGRAGWNIVTTDNAWTGADFRRGGWLAHERRYERAEQFVEAALALWSGSGVVDRHTDLVNLRATPTVPPSPQGRIDPHPPTPIHLQPSGVSRSVTPRAETRHRTNAETLPISHSPRPAAALLHPCHNDLPYPNETNEALTRRCSSPAQTSPTFALNDDAGGRPLPGPS